MFNNRINGIMQRIKPVWREVSIDITEPLHRKDNSIYDSFINSEIPKILQKQGLILSAREKRIKEIMVTAENNKWNIDTIIEGLEWINGQAVSSEGIIVTNNSIKYGPYTYKNHKDIKGFYSNLPNSPIVFGERRCSFSIIDLKGSFSFKIGIGRDVEEGKFEYNPEIKRMVLVDGKFTHCDGEVAEGKFEYNTKIKRMLLVDGKVTYSNGNVAEGKFEYNPEIKRMVLVDGKVTYSNGNVAEGKFEYNTELKEEILVDGKMTDCNEVIAEGKFEYNTKLKEILLVDGKVTYCNGGVQEVKFEYNTELKSMVLVSEKINKEQEVK